MKKLAIFILLMGLTIAQTSQAKVYLESFDPAKPSIIQQTFVTGEDNGWTNQLGQGWYGMSNISQTGNVRFYNVTGISNETNLTLANSVVSVEVGGNFSDALSGAGLIYRYSPSQYTYWAFVINRRGAFSIYKRGTMGLKRVMGGGHPIINQEGSNLLSIRPGLGNEVRFSINGLQVASLGDPEITGYAAGVLAISPGTFRFDNFKLETSTP